MFRCWKLGWLIKNKCKNIPSILKIVHTRCIVVYIYQSSEHWCTLGNFYGAGFWNYSFGVVFVFLILYLRLPRIQPAPVSSAMFMQICLDLIRRRVTVSVWWSVSRQTGHLLRRIQVLPAAAPSGGGGLILFTWWAEREILCTWSYLIKSYMGHSSGWPASVAVWRMIKKKKKHHQVGSESFGIWHRQGSAPHTKLGL